MIPSPEAVPLRPHLRPEVEVRRVDGAVQVGDPVLGRRLDLGDIGDVVDAFDGRTVPELVAALGPRAEGVVRSLALLNLLDGPGAGVVARMRAVREGRAPLEVRTLPDARFACQGSGACCRNYVFGPLTDADVARVSALDLSPWGVEGPFFEVRRRPDGRGERFLRTTSEGRCVFLEPGERCGLHVRHGGASKPGFCQLFPLTVHPTLDGLQVVDAGECASFAAASRLGPPLREQFAALQHLVPPNLPLQHPVVWLGPGLPADAGWFLPLQRALVEDVSAIHPAVSLRHMGARVEAWATALRCAPLVEGGLEAELARALAAEVAPWPASPDGAGALAALAAELRDLYAAAMASPAPPPFSAELVAALDAVSAGAPLPPADPAEAELFARSFESSLFGARALLAGRPLAALLRLAIGWLVARHVAGTRELGFGHMVAARRVWMPWEPAHRALLRAEPRARAILAALPEG